jgi:stress response protein SCP2/uncharacterized protein (AIM24 family)
MAREFQRGHKAKISDLTAGRDLYVGVQIAAPGLTFDISCFGLDADERLSDDRYFVFYNQPKSPEEAIQQLGAQAGDTESFRVTLDRIPVQVQKLSFTATIDGTGQMSQIGPGYLRIVAGGDEVARYSFTGTEFSTERAVMLGDIYLKGEWRFAAVGQGFDGGLAALLGNFGGEVAEEAPQAEPEPVQGAAPGFASAGQAAPAPGFAPPAGPGPAAPVAPAAPQPPIPAAPPPPAPAAPQPAAAAAPPPPAPHPGHPGPGQPPAPQTGPPQHAAPPPAPSQPSVHAAPTVAALVLPGQLPGAPGPQTPPPGPVPPPGQPGQAPHPGQGPYSGQGPYPGQPGQAPYPGQGPYPGQAPYPGQQPEYAQGGQFSSQAAPPPGAPPMSAPPSHFPGGPSPFPGQPGHPGQPAPYGRPGAPGQHPPPPGVGPQGHAPSQPTAPGVQGALGVFHEAPTGERWALQNSKLIRVDLGVDGQPALARQGSMVLYQGKVEFGYKGAGFRGRVLGGATGQEMQLMRCTGRGQVFLAENAANLHPIELQGDAICVSADSVLAFDESLQHEVRRIEGHGIPGGALFTLLFQGTGTVVVKTHGTPVVLPVTPTTYADSNAIVAWSAAAQVIISSQVRLRRSAYPGHSGETVNLQFRGAPGNFIVVQPYEV